ncbi:GAF domain-containing protein, partial [Patulibacter sp. S7RM1-6]
MGPETTTDGGRVANAGAAADAILELSRAALTARDADAFLAEALRWTCRSLGFRRGAVFVPDATGRRFAGRVGHPAAEVAPLLAEGPLRPEGDALTRTLVDDRSPVAIPDVARDARTVRTVLRGRGVRSLLGVPLLHDDETIGLLLLDHGTERHPCAPGHVATAARIAALLAAALVRLDADRRAGARSERLARQNALMRHAAAVDGRLARIALDGGGSHGLVAAVGELTGKPAVLYDVDRRRVAAAERADAAVRLLERA